MEVRGPVGGKWAPTSRQATEKWQNLQDRAAPLPVQTLTAAHIPAKRVRPQGIRAAGFQIAFGLLPQPPRGSTAESSSSYDSNSLANNWPQPSRSARAQSQPSTLVLDGFMLLAMSRCEFPDEATRIVVNGEHATTVATEDLEYFTNVAYLDIGDNRLPLAPFGSLPKLQELRMPCNMVATVGPELRGFPVLEVLDLSYNALEAESIVPLAQLPALRELDLTCNALERLPTGMEKFQGLQELSLERNRLQGDEPLMVLAYMPQLRKLNLAYNYLSRVAPNLRNPPARVQWMPNLEWLSLAHNYVAEEEALAPLQTWGRLEQLMLYGNPICSAMGGEEGGGGLAHLVKEEEGQRPLTVMTSKPQPKGRRQSRLYSGTELQQVDDPTVLGNSAFRARRGEDREKQQGLAGKSNPLPSTAEEEQQPRAPAVAAPQSGSDADESPEGGGGRRRRKLGQAHGDEGTFLTGVYFSESDSESDDEGREGDGEPGELEVPPLFLRTDLSGQQQSPAKLRTALSALRYALKHPLTAEHIPSKGERQLTRPTAVTKLRQRPRVPYEPRESSEDVEPGEQKRVGRNALRNMEGVVDSMNTKVAQLQHETSSANETEQTMESLIAMVNRVMDTYHRN